MLNDLLDALAGQDLEVVLPLLLVFLTLDASVGIGLVTPGDGLLLVAGATADSAGEALALIGAGLVACFAGASGGHWLGRRYGSRLRHGRLGRRVGERRWASAERLFERNGWALALAYFLPVLHALTPAVAGTVGMPYRRFMPWAMLGSAAWVSTYVTLGALAGEVARRHAEWLLPVVAAAVVVVIGITAAARRVVSGGRAPRRRSASRPPR
ncbi:membrane-associated protein [Nonomuraea thailandensis]|uniref:Membrane-associated protein n=1 Tax=Nonomuraea thailandensis TaxID=1188745 RepID=A0A9X2K289_9ACTN|nr:VTT domain-containing protein [Nonomuraea thailandensis]MCP2354296.1 membrane-associated protein [Nonomuraea thailandensis]